MKCLNKFFLLFIEYEDLKFAAKYAQHENVIFKNNYILSWIAWEGRLPRDRTQPKWLKLKLAI